jgi:DNA-directed RNA polymerase subunit H (RpoH/RPB5)
MVVEEKTFNILKHNLVPDQTILKEDEIKEITDKLNITINQFPKILTTDAVVKAIDAQEGDVIKSVRPSPTSGETVYYRIVVKKLRKK